MSCSSSPERLSPCCGEHRKPGCTRRKYPEKTQDCLLPLSHLLGSQRSELSRERVRSLNTPLLYALRNGKDQPEPEFLAFAEFHVLFAFLPRLAIRTCCPA